MKKASKTVKTLWAKKAQIAAQKSSLVRAEKELKAALRKEFGRSKSLDLGAGKVLARVEVEVSEKFVEAYSYETIKEVVGG